MKQNNNTGSVSGEMATILQNLTKAFVNNESKLPLYLRYFQFVLDKDSAGTSESNFHTTNTE